MSNQEIVVPTAVTSEVVDVVPEVTKMSLCEPIFKEIYGNKEIEKQRKVFMDRTMKDLGLSKNCAASYYQMLKMEADGKGSRYKHHKRKAKAVTEVVATELVVPTELVAETEVEVKVA